MGETTGFRYVILGSGRQGTACAFDLAVFGGAAEIVLADARLDFAERAAERLRALLPKSNRTTLTARAVSVADPGRLAETLTGADAVLSAVPYYLNPAIARAAIDARVSMCDLGGDTPTVLEERRLDPEARSAGVRILPDCGLAPGMNNLLAVYAMGKLDAPESVRIWCGGLPQTPVPPLGYRLAFNLEGLINNYFGRAWVLRDGRVAEIESFTEPETVEFRPPLGRCEAIITAGAVSTCPWTFEGRLDRYEYKTVRYPGHFEKFRLLRDLGLLDTRPVTLKGQTFVPRDAAIRVIGDRIANREVPDLVVLRVVCGGKQSGRPAESSIELMDFHDKETGFTAMERTTGFSTAILMAMLAREEIAGAGVLPIETAVEPEKYVEALRQRGFDLRESVRPAG
jgi:lysine 6-dehydrogenase